MSNSIQWQKNQRKRRNVKWYFVIVMELNKGFYKLISGVNSKQKFRDFRIRSDELVSIVTSHQYILELIGTLLLNGIDLPVDGQTAAFLKKFNGKAEYDNECLFPFFL